jgi:hypothetical protein
MKREAIDDAIGSERSCGGTSAHVRTANESPVNGTCRRKGPSRLEVTVEVTYRIQAPPAADEQLDGAAAAIGGEDFYDGDSGTISIV